MENRDDTVNEIRDENEVNQEQNIEQRHEDEYDWKVVFSKIVSYVFLIIEWVGGWC